jgi:amidohydrolase
VSQRVRAALARIWTNTDTVAGAGFLIGDRHLLTCAHVAALASNSSPHANSAPLQPIVLDFPLLDSPSDRLSALVVRWYPVAPNSTGDIAGLLLDGHAPLGAHAIDLVDSDSPWQHVFRTFGFPAGAPAGDWAEGKLRDIQASRWLQIEQDRSTGRRIQRGYSGAPVWVDQLGAAVGMVVAADRSPGDRVAYAIPTQVLMLAWPEAFQRAILPSCPYRGLSSFERSDAEYFFGHEEATTFLIDAIKRRPFVVLSGPSGSGKSSLTMAGVASELHQDQEFAIVRCRPRRQPFEELAEALIAALDPGLSTAAILQESRSLAAGLADGELGRVIERLLSKSRKDSLLIVVDQFEELYTDCRDLSLRGGFLEELFRASGVLNDERGHKLSVLFVVNREYFPVLSELPQYMALEKAAKTFEYVLAEMTSDQLKDVIQKPAQMLGVTFEDGLVERILDDLGSEPGRLPLLQFALTRLWERQDQRRLRHVAYGAIGTVKGALAQYADDVFNGLSEPDRVRAKRIFLQLTQPGGTLDTRRVATPYDLGTDDWELVRFLASKRLIVIDRDPEGAEIAEIAHEALIRGWSRLQEWIGDSRGFRIWQERLRSVISSRESDEEVFLPESALAEAEEWLKLRPNDVTAKEREFIRRSRAMRQPTKRKSVRTNIDSASNRPQVSGRSEAATARTRAGPTVDLGPFLAVHLPELIHLRRHLHAHPELGGFERQTSALVARRLEAVGLRPSLLPPGTGLMCDIGQAAGPVIALCAELDALSVPDDKDVPYRSTVPGICHACGHDVHTTILLGTALALAQHAEALPGRVRVIFQPNSEVERNGSGGSIDVIASLGLKDVVGIFGLHCDPTIEVGELGIWPGLTVPGEDWFEVSLSSSGAESVDLVHLIARVVCDTQATLSQLLGSLASSYIRYDDIEFRRSEDSLLATARARIRATDRKTYEEQNKPLERIVEAVVAPFPSVTYRIDYSRGHPPVLNDTQAAAIMIGAAHADGLSNDALSRYVEHGGDFAWYLEEVPGVMGRLGVRIPDMGTSLRLHTGSFDVDERSIAVGTRVLVMTALRALDAYGPTTLRA